MNSKRITVEGDGFKCGALNFRAWGFNYWHSDSPGSDPAGGDWSVLCNYKTETIEREVAAMAAIGANTLRVWFAYSPDNWSSENTMMEEARKNLNHFMDVCACYSIYVILTVGGGGSMWGISRRLGDVFKESPAQVYTDREISRMFLEDIIELIESGGLAGKNNLFAIDLANEPVFGIPRIPGMKRSKSVWDVKGLTFEKSLHQECVVSAWRCWASNHTDLGAEPKVPNSNDFLGPEGNSHLAKCYQDFVHYCFTEHAQKFSLEMKKRWPDILTTIGFGYGGTGANFEGGSKSEILQILTLTQNIRNMQHGLDFVCVHLYNGTDSSRMRFLREFVGSNKPLLIEEFGHIPKNIEENTMAESEPDKQAQKELWEVILEGVIKFNYSGALGCNYCDTCNAEPHRNIWSRMGIVNRYGEPKPACKVFQNYTSSNTDISDFHPPALEYEPELYRHDVEALGKLYLDSFI